MNNYGSRKPGTNPRTGELLVPSADVQATPVTDPLDSRRISMQVKTETGTRMQRFTVRVHKDCSETELLTATIQTVKRFGFTPGPLMRKDDR